MPILERKPLFTYKKIDGAMSYTWKRLQNYYSNRILLVKNECWINKQINTLVTDDCNNVNDNILSEEMKTPLVITKWCFRLM